MAKTLYVSVKHYDRLGLGIFPNAGPNPHIGGMKKRYWGKDALCVKCGRYVYNVDQETYEKVAEVNDGNA